MQVDETKNHGARFIYRFILVFNVGLMTLPIAYLPLANGNMTLALIYIVGGSALLVLTMFVLSSMDGTMKAAEDS